MSTDVVMPQMGESIAEGTITRWLKKVGEQVERDEPLFEISTDKVDAEIPSPAAGVVTEILAKEGDTVAVNSVLARLGEAGEVGAGASAAGAGISASTLSVEISNKGSSRCTVSPTFFNHLTTVPSVMDSPI
jgi:2-oxoglutarate dehydrogenase E2 component (dihydrolipoamide succinyltransferase)